MRETPRGWELRLRVGGGERLEATMPKAMGKLRAEARRRRLLELAALLRPLGVSKESQRLMRKLAVAVDNELAEKLEKVIRRFAREPHSAVASTERQATLTFREFGMRWALGHLAEEYPRYLKAPDEKSIKGNRSMVQVLSRTIGDIPMNRLTHADAKRALAALPKELSASRYRHYAQVIQSVCRRAVEPCGLIEATAYPLPWKGFLPPTGDPPSFPILYPRDDARLLAGEAPLWRRVLYGFAVREGLRASHIFRLCWQNIDFENGFITIGYGKNNKNSRTWELNAGVANALDRFRGKAKLDAHIFPRLTENEMVDLAENLRNDLYAAGVTREVRPDLFASGEGQEPLRFQDLRATFVSLHLAQGWSYQDVMMRTQHTSTKVLEHHYSRRVDVAKRIIAKQGPLLPLDVALGWAPLPKGQKAPSRTRKVGEEVGEES